MEGNYKPAHSANNANYSSAPNNMDTGSAPFTVSYDQAGTNIPQAPQYNPANNFSYTPNPNYVPVNPAPVNPQLSYATSGAGYGNGNNANMGSRVADAVRNIDTDRIAGNIESGIGYVTDKANEFTTAAKDKLANPSRRKALAIMGGAVASLALAISLGGAVLNKTNSSNNSQIPPAATSNNNSSFSSNQAPEVENTDPNMNVETADSEHDGKISYKVYKMYFPPNSDKGQYILDHEGEVSTQYDDDDLVDARKEITGNDLLDKTTGRINSDGSLDSLLAVNHREVRDALKSLLGQYGDNLNKKYLEHYRNNGRDTYADPVTDSFGDVATVAIKYDLSKYLPDIRDYRKCSVLYKIVSSNAEYTAHFGQRFQWTIGGSTMVRGSSLGYINIYESDSLPTAKQLIEIIKKERKDTRNNENNSTDDGFITIYNVG